MDSRWERSEYPVKLSGLPTKTAEDVDKAQRLISVILYGPEIQYKIVDTNKDNVKTQITRCPFQNRAKELGLETENLFENCKAYNKSFIDNLDPKYTQRFGNAMCIGDPYCETFTELRK